MRMTTAKDLPKVCFLCGRNGAGDPLDAHHIFGGANRMLSERYALVIPLCHDRCHENGKDAVHRNAAVAQAVHEFGQRLAMERMGWSIEEFRAVFGRNYLPEPLKDEDAPAGGATFPAGDPSGGALAAGRDFPHDGKVTKGSPGAPSERFPGTPPPGQGGSAPIGSPSGGRETKDGLPRRFAPRNDAGDGGRRTEDGGRETRDGRRGTQDAGRETRDAGFRITEEEDLPEWLLI